MGLPNLARQLGNDETETEVTSAVLSELSTCNIPIVALVDRRFTEVPSRYIGAIQFADGRRFEFKRAWVYWTVKCDPPLPAEITLSINQMPYKNHAKLYSGDTETLGDVVRAHGFAGGMDAEMVTRVGRCASWDVDTLLGLDTFVSELRKRLGAEVASAVCGKPKGF